MSTEEKAAIDRFKRSGGFDAIRKDVLQTWEGMPQSETFKTRLHDIVKDEVQRDPGLLERDRGKAATLLAGVVERYDAAFQY